MSPPGKILIVEDEDILARNLQEHFRRLGWETLIAGTGESAVTIAIEFRPGIILLDYFLPDMTGFQILEAIRKQHCCTSILMTGHPEHVVLTDARRYCIAHLLTKPFSMAELDSVFWNRASQYCVKCFSEGDTAGSRELMNEAGTDGPPGLSKL
jgi:DNA-binding response OmpR family regulator